MEIQSLYQGQCPESDYKQYMEFIDLVFKFEPNAGFLHVLPKLYKACYHPCENALILKENNQILAAVGIFPMEGKIGQHSLNVQGIGNVSVHPEARSRGYMKQLMNAALKEMIARGSDYSVLGGLRNRYQYFSYERCGRSYRFFISSNCIDHKIGTSITALSLEEIQNSSCESLSEINKRQQTAPVYFSRGENDHLLDVMHSWESVPYAVYDGKKMVGYIVAQEKTAQISEFHIDAGYEDALLAACVKKFGNGNGCTFLCHSYETLYLSYFFDRCESYTISDNENFSVFCFERVVRAYLDLQNALTPLPDGVLSVLIHGIAGDETLTLRVQSGKTYVEKGISPDSCVPPLEFDHLAAMRFFFRDHAAEHKNLPLAIKSWFPLPLAHPNLDQV